MQSRSFLETKKGLSVKRLEAVMEKDRNKSGGCRGGGKKTSEGTAAQWRQSSQGEKSVICWMEVKVLF